MAPVDDFDGVIERCQQALREFVKGNPEPMQQMFAHREDVTLANPTAPQGGRDRWLRDRGQALYPGAGQRRVDRAGQGQDRPGDEVVSFPLRVTTIFRPEDGTWKIVHRHADTVTAARPPESMIQEGRSTPRAIT